MTRVLFICHGNICRSPMAEFIFKDMIEKKNLIDKFHIDSCATSTEEIWNGIGNPIYPPAKNELIRLGIGKTSFTDFSKKRARQLTKRDYDDFDFLICSDSFNLKNASKIVNDKDNKLHLLMEYAGNPNRSISDPWYTGDFRKTSSDIIEGLTYFLKYLEKENFI